MTKQYQNILSDNIIKTLIILLAFTLPLFFLPVTSEFYDFNKKALLFATSSIILIVWLARNILSKNLRLTITPSLLPLALLTAATLASTFIASPSTQQSLIASPTIYISLLILYLIITSRFTQNKQVKQVLTALKASGALLSIFAIFSYTNLFTIIFPQAPQWLQATTFSPSGSFLNLLLFIIPIFTLTLIDSLKSKAKALEASLSFVSIGFMAAGIATTLLTISTQTGRLALLPLSTAWEIAVENFKNVRSALFGVGPGNFVDAFTLSKPINFNLSPDWSLRFTVSRNYPLHLLTTLGLFGFLSYALLIFNFFKSLLKSKNQHLNPIEKAINLSLITTIILQLIYPQGTLSLTLFVLLLALKQTLRKLEADKQSQDISLRLFAITVMRSDQPESFNRDRAEVLPWVIGIPLALLTTLGLYLGSTRIYAAEVTFKKSLDAAALNKGTETYNTQIKAISQNPRNPLYRTSYAMTNLALANTIASQKEVSTTDRQNITQLVQQAIREAKIATQINPKRTSSWETLATIYRNLSGVAQGAQEWAIASYVQAIKTDPNNPQLRLSLGGIYYALADYDQAIRFFEQATLLKPDWANGHYNLSAAYREKGNLEAAIDQMKQVLQHLDPSAADYTKAQNELKALNDQLGQAATDTPSLPAESELTEPEPLPTPVPKSQQVKLPENAGPDTEATPGAVPTPSISPSPKPSPTPTP